MGKRILSTAITLDVSSMSAAPVSPAGAMRIRPKSDGSTIQLSYNAGAYFDLGGGGAGGAPGGSATELQYRAGTSTFGAVTGSSVDGAGKVTVLNFVTDEATINGGSNKGVYYRDTSENIVTTAAGTDGQYLKVSAIANLPIFGALNVSDATAGTLPLARGGTATSIGSAPTNGQLLIGNGTNFTVATLTAGSGVTITNGAGAITIASTGAGGALPAGSGSEIQYRVDGSTFGAVTSSSVSGSAVTISNITTDELTINGGSTRGVYYRDTSGNIVTTGTGTSGEYLKVGAVGSLPTFGALNVGDATAGTLPLARGGTGTSIGSAPTNGQLLIGNGTNFTVATLTAGTNISLTNGAGSITINATGGGGTPGGSGSEIQYRSGASTFGAITSSSVSGADITLGGNVILATGTISFPDSVRQTFNPGSTQSGLNVGSHTGDPSSPSNGDILYNTTTGTFRFRQAGAWVSLSSGTTPGGSGSELQYRSSATTFGAVSNSSVSGSVITLGTSTDFTTLQGAGIALQGDSGLTFSLRLHHASGAPSLTSYRSRGTNASKTAVQSGDNLYTGTHYGYYDSTSLRIGGQSYFQSRSTWSSTEATAIHGISTIHGTNVVPLMRQVLGGFVILTDNTLANLFTFTFAAADHKAASGEIELLFIAKQTSGSNQIAAYRRVMNFTVYHDGATNTGVMQVILNTGGNTAIETSGTFDIKHTTGSAGSEVAITTSLLPTTFDSVTYKVLVDSSFTVSAMYCFFNIRMNGECELTLA